MSLFPNTKIDLKLPDATVYYIPDFLVTHEADHYFKILKNEIEWRQENITIFAKTYPQPRLTALYGIDDKSYTYSNITMHPKPFMNELLEIKSKVETELKHLFTTCLLNLYRDGNDSNGWHADDEKELGYEPVIASISLGEERVFQFKHKKEKQLKKSIILKHGSLLVMQGKTQEFWKHQIPKTKKLVGPRINLTYRYIK